MEGLSLLDAACVLLVACAGWACYLWNQHLALQRRKMMLETLHLVGRVCVGTLSFLSEAERSTLPFSPRFPYESKSRFQSPQSSV